MTLDQTKFYICISDIASPTTMKRRNGLKALEKTFLSQVRLTPFTYKKNKTDTNIVMIKSNDTDLDFFSSIFHGKKTIFSSSGWIFTHFVCILSLLQPFICL